eukprot:Awhi_evm1s1178
MTKVEGLYGYTKTQYFTKDIFKVWDLGNIRYHRLIYLKRSLCPDFPDKSPASRQNKTLVLIKAFIFYNYKIET